MEQSIQILTWAMAGGFGVTWGMMAYLIKRQDKQGDKLDRITETMCRIEGMLAGKDCCIMKHDHNEKAK